MSSRRPISRQTRGRAPFIQGTAGGGGSPPAVPTLTAPANNDNVFNSVAVTVSATSPDGDLDRIDWVLDPGGSEVIIATDAVAPYSQSWTPTGITLGAHTLVARAVRGGQSTDSASITITVGEVLHLLAEANGATGVLRAWQSDFGVTPGTTLRAFGPTPPAVTVSGSPPSGTIPAVRVEMQLGGARGVATFRYSADNGANWIEQNVVTAATYPALVPSALAGITFAFPNATYDVSNTYLGTTSGWVCQKTGATAAMATAATQPVVGTLSGRPNIIWSGAQRLFESTLPLPAPGTTPTFVWFVARQTTWVINKALFAGAGVSVNISLLTKVATPNVQQFCGSVNNTIGIPVGTLVRGEAYYSASAADYVKVGATIGNVGSCGGTAPSTGFSIGDGSTGAFPAFVDYQAMILFNNKPSGAVLAALSAAASVMYPGIAV
jgi:hypothetical protein